MTTIINICNVKVCIKCSLHVLFYAGDERRNVNLKTCDVFVWSGHNSKRRQRLTENTHEVKM